MRLKSVYALSVLAIVLIAGVACLQAVPAVAQNSCSAEMRRTRAAVSSALAEHAAATFSAPESNAAKLHHQPTPGSIARAERRYDNWPNGNEAVAAMKRARHARSRGDTEGCLTALREARAAIGAGQ